MRKLAILAVASLIATSATAAPTQNLDAQALAKTILNMHKFQGSEKGSFAIVYGGQDISRTNPGKPEGFGNPTLVA